MKKISEGRKEREHPLKPDNSLVQRFPSNRTLYLFTAEMRLDSISRSIWFRREGASQPISRVLVGNVYHLLAVRTYVLCDSHPQPGRETQTINGGQMVEGGEWGIGRRTGMWISGS